VSQQTELRVREQAGCLPVRGKPPEVEVLLVTSRYTGEWVAPKGGIEPGETAEAAALREAEEEAGVRGRIVGHLGRFCYDLGSQSVALEVFELEAVEELDHWPERLQRRRRWFTLSEALAEVSRPEVLCMLRAFANEVGGRIRP
jgi:8-oxo-dGTP pyrophosphatase MutT (NUDIX family)